MSNQESLPRRAVASFNGCVTGLRDSPRWGKLVAKRITVVTYTGRRSGRTFSTPVAYRRSGNVVTIPVRLAGRKNWWRNFTGEGNPLSLRLEGVDRAGHAIADRGDKGGVTVTVRLDDQPAGLA